MSIMLKFSRMGSHMTCSHILNIHQENPPKHKGNLYLSSVYTLDNDSVKKDFKINCVLTIMDSTTFRKFNVKQKIENLNIKHHKWIDLLDL